MTRLVPEIKILKFQWLKILTSKKCKGIRRTRHIARFPRPSGATSLAERCVVLKSNSARQRFVNRTSRGDLCEPFSLGCVEITLDMDVACDVIDQSFVSLVTVQAVVGVNARKVIAGANRFKRQAFVTAIPGNRRASTRSKRAQQQFIRVRSRIGSAGSKRFVARPFVPTIG